MRDDIPRQEDIEQWTHLEGIHLPNVDAQVGLLIASDVPEALDPLEVKNSQDGGPYATRTAWGWAVNGPLYCQHERYHTRNFFVKSDVQLNEIVMDAINRDFNESIADDRTELSQKEQQFMDNVKNTVELIDTVKANDNSTSRTIRRHSFSLRRHDVGERVGSISC
jgi:hypothetical protein